VHIAGWPEPVGAEGDPALLPAIGEALVGIRRAKTDAKVSQKSPVASARITGPEHLVALLALAAGDVRSAGRIDTLSFEGGTATIGVSDVVLRPTETA
jgi:valyl-tRNA synthetase